MSPEIEIGDLVLFSDPDGDIAGDDMIGIVLDVVNGEESSDSMSSKEREIFDAIMGLDDEYYLGLPSFTIHSCMCLISWFSIKKIESNNTSPLTLWVPCDYLSKAY